jgi:hypothetical protein
VEPRAAAEFLREVRETRGPEALENRPPIALAVRMVPGYSLDDPASLYEPSMLVYPVFDPVLYAMMLQAGATPRGPVTWQVGMGEDADPTPARRLLQATAPGTMIPDNWVLSGRSPRDLNGHKSLNRHEWDRGIPNIPMLNGLFHQAGERHSNMYGTSPYREGIVRTASGYGFITFKLRNGSLWFRAYTHKLELPEALVAEIGNIDLNLRPIGRQKRSPKPIRPAQAVAICEWASSVGMELVDADASGSLAQMRYTLAHSVVAWTRPGRPAQASVAVGTRVKLSRKGLPRTLVTTPTMTLDEEQRIELRVQRASRINKLDSGHIALIQQSGVEVLMHPAVADMAALSAAEPVIDSRLKHRQGEAIGLHLATDVGFVNFSAPGAGKTVMVLEAMRRRALRIGTNLARQGSGYRGLVIAEANVRKQFAGESRDWFPAALTLTVETASQAEELAELLESAGDCPVVIVTSYALASQVSDVLNQASSDAELALLFEEDDAADEQEEGFIPGLGKAEPEPEPEPEPEVEEVPVEDEREITRVLPPPLPFLDPKRVHPTLFDFLEDLALEALSREEEEPLEPFSLTLGQVLLATPWDDVIADEAAGLTNANSKQSRALWAIRKGSHIAIALTGTPYRRSADDLGAIIAWSRNDRHMFAGVSLAKEFDLSKPEDVIEFGKAVGPVMFRIDESEFAEHLPTETEPLIIELTPTDAEKRLAEAARFQLKRNLDELIALMAALEEADPNDPEVAEIKNDLVAARGAVLGGGQLARMAASDPAALLGSTSAGAMLLESMGLITDANAQPGTKRTAVVNLCVDRIGQGERIVLFTEFATVARGLIADLRSAGLRVGAILGGGGKRRDLDIESFQKGELDIVVSTSSGERGLNLQTATTLIHYDLAWSPTSIIQRTGRIKRIGSSAKSIQVIFPIMKDTIEERVVAVVVARAIGMMQTLDGARGKSMTNTSFGKVFAKLIGAANIDELSGNDATLLEVTRELIAV